MLKIITITYIIILSFAGIILKNNGFIDRYKNIYKRNILFNDILRNYSWHFADNYNIQRFSNKKLIKILIIGDSHSKDLFNVFIQNKELFPNYEFKRFGINRNRDAIKFDKDFNIEKIDSLKKNNIFNQANVILISDYFRNNELKNLEIFIKKIKPFKKIVLTSLTNIYEDDFRYNSFYDLTIFDHYIFKKYHKIKKDEIDFDVSKEDIDNINKFYFDHKKNTDNINSKLLKLAEKHNLKILLKDQYMCSDKKCDGVTKEGYKIFYDESHYTLEGAKHFGKKIYETRWFKID